MHKTIRVTAKKGLCIKRTHVLDVAQRQFRLTKFIVKVVNAMEEKDLSSLNIQKFMDQSAWNFKRAWKGTVDISVWLRAKVRNNGRMYLILEYQDKESKRAIPIDRCMGGASESMLLNGRVNMTGTGPLESCRIKVKYEGVAGHILVEELTLKFPGANTSIRDMKLAV